MSGLAESVKTFQISKIAITVPASGVHRPNISSTPAAAAIVAGTGPPD
jgi:hypothetical protein